MVRFQLWKQCRRILMLLAVLGALLIPAYAADERSLSDARAPKGEYTATLEEMAVKRLYAYGFIDATDETEEKKDAVLPIQLDGTPDRLDAALMLYRACGTQPEAPCPLLDVPEEYTDAVAWLYESGATKGVGNQHYGTGDVTEEQFTTMLARLLRWETDDVGIIEYVMRERGLAPLIAVDGDFTFGEMYQIVCNLLDHAYPDRCVPKNGKELTPKMIVLRAHSCEDALAQLREAMTYLPGSIEVYFSDACPQDDVALFQKNLDWDGGKKTMPLLALTNPRWNYPFEIQTVENRHFRIIIDSCSQAAEATASVTNWLSVFEDEQYAEALRSFYLNHLFPLRNLTEYGRVIQCHDLLCRLASYDYSEYNNELKKATGARPKAHDLVGFMENNKVVCDGYANAYSWMLMELGVDSYVVSGRGNDGGHAWNKVCLHGRWYNVDACWDDTGFSLRQYFLKSDDWMTEHRHSFTDAFSTTIFESPESSSAAGTTGVVSKTFIDF